MEFETIIYEHRDRTACITLNRPDKLNAIDHTMIRELNEAYEAAEADADVWTVIVTGVGRALCSGADVETVEQPKPGLDTRGEPLLGSYWQWKASEEATPPYLSMAKPIICAVNGVAAGAGLDLVTTCDIAIVSTEAQFLDPHVSIGLASGREAVRLARVLPLPVAMRVALMGTQERLGAQRAYDLGLVTELVEPEHLMDRAWEIAGMINQNAPLAVRGTRLAVRKGLSLPVHEAELLAEGHRMRVAQTDDALEGARAFLDKRPPEWKGC